MAIRVTTTGESESEFVKTIRNMGYRHSLWEIWQDFIFVSAAAISNSVDMANREEREHQYMQVISKYTEDERNRFPQLLALLVEALEHNPEQDFLGRIFMQLEFGNHWKGQFFTPYTICQLMSSITIGDAKEKIQDKGWVSVSDPACGAGATLIAAAHEFSRSKINYQTSVIFAAQDIDMTAGLMCYLQLSLLGCPGFVVIRDSLAKPMIGDVLFQSGSDTWLTPMYFSEIWHHRRLAYLLSRSFGNKTSPTRSEDLAEEEGQMLLFAANE